MIFLPVDIINQQRSLPIQALSLPLWGRWIAAGETDEVPRRSTDFRLFEAGNLTLFL